MRTVPRQAGFTYLGVLFLVAIMGVGLAATGMIWSTAQQREKERELLFVGHEFRKAIGSYYERTPGTVKRYPANFTDLLKDNRQLATVRHLRRMYVDPMGGQPAWGIVRAPDGGIMGVHSLAKTQPIKREKFAQHDAAFEKSASYQDWRFIYEPPQPQLFQVPGSNNSAQK
jgi:type II secretory pathway pseudopilin PulG